MRRILLAAATLILTLSAAAKSDSPVAQRADYWQQRLNREIPVGSSRSAILNWALTNHLTASDDPQTHDLRIGLEEVPEPAPKPRISPSAVVCKSWHISAALKLDAKGQLASAEVQTLGNCL